MTETIKLIQNHSSVRKFRKERIPEEMLKEILNAARTTSSWSMLQTVSIISIDNPEIRKKVTELCYNQEYINEASEFWIFCSDFYRNHTIAPEVDLGYAQYSLIGTFDAGLMAQNTLTAAESLGLGGVMIGGVRIHIREMSELLKLPKYVIPLVGLCLGYPEGEKEAVKPKLPKEILFHTDEYHEMDKEELGKYDAVVKAFYKDTSLPSLNKEPRTWTEHIRSTLDVTNSISIDNLMDYLNDQGMNSK